MVKSEVEDNPGPVADPLDSFETFDLDQAHSEGGFFVKS